MQCQICHSLILLIVVFPSYAPWCPACRSLTRSWSEFADWTHDLGLDGVSSVDVTENPGLSGR